MELSQDILSSALSHAVRMKLIPTNPCRRVEPVEHRPERPIPWNLHEARAFVTALELPRHSDWRVLFQLLSTAGVRLSEGLGLLWEDVDLVHNLVLVENQLHVKGSARALGRTKSAEGKRRISISAAMSAILARHRDSLAATAARTPGWKERGLVFPSLRMKGQAGRQDSTSHAFHRICDEAGLCRIRLQDLRRLGLSLHLVASGGNMLATKAHAGHSTLAMTSHYTYQIVTDPDGIADRSADLVALGNGIDKGINRGAEGPSEA